MTVAARAACAARHAQTAEARALDPAVLSNVRFANARGAMPSYTHAYKTVASPPLRGLLQAMVPPTGYASPAPI